MIYYRKSHMILLEIVIALAIVALCVLPLISPHVELVKSHIRFAKLMEMDRAANLIYIDILEQMHRNTLPFPEIKNSQPLPLKLTHFEQEGNLPPIEGTYSFSGKSKGNAASRLYLLQLKIKLKPKGADDEAAREFQYPICVLRHVQAGDNTGEQNDS